MLEILLLLSMSWVWFFYGLQRKALSITSDPPEPARYPSVTVIRPIKGIDSGIKQNVIAAFEDQYPGETEILFVFDDNLDPAVEVVESVIRERQRQGINGAAKMIFSGSPPRNRTGKLNAMIVAFKEASHELVAFVDSDIRQDPDDLRRLVATLLSDPKAGSAFPTVVSNAAPKTLGDVGYSVMMNGLYEPSALATAARRNGTLPFIMGHMMVLRREAITAIGGLETAEGQLVDDMYLGRRMVQCGYQNRLSPKPVATIQQDCPTEEFVGILIRWIAFSISGLPFWSTKLPHALTGIALWTGILTLAYGIGTLNPALMAISLLTTLSVPLSINDLHYRLSSQPLPLKYAWGSMIIWIAAPLIYAQIWIGREINWRGRRYRLNLRSTLS